MQSAAWEGGHGDQLQPGAGRAGRRIRAELPVAAVNRRRDCRLRREGDGMSELIVTRHGRVQQLTLNRPAARNALNNALLTQIAEQLEDAAADADIAVCVIYGSERCFAAGADLNEMA